MPLKLYVRFACLRDDRGASIVEYAILVALIAAAVVGAVQFFGGNVESTLDQAVSEMDAHFP